MAHLDIVLAVRTIATVRVAIVARVVPSRAASCFTEVIEWNIEHDLSRYFCAIGLRFP